MSKRGEGSDDLVFRITKAARETEFQSGLHNLDLACRSILYFIGECAAAGRSLRVTDILKQPGFGTPPTVFSRLAELEKTGWIQTKRHPNDGRAKLVEPTSHAVRSFRKVSLAVQKVL
jgi:DNA-binding MarR family transcriptional regulator